MKNSLRNYNQMSGKDPVDKLPFWASFAFLIGMGVGIGISKFLIS